MKKLKKTTKCATNETVQLIMSIKVRNATAFSFDTRNEKIFFQIPVSMQPFAHSSSC